MAAKTAKTGDIVSVEYTGTLETGDVFDSSKGKAPLEFELGKHLVIKGFEDAVVGMKVGEEKDIKIDAEEAYGKRNESYVKDLPRQTIPKDLELKKGMLLIFKREDGLRMPATVLEINDNIVKVDFNHPLAGEKLNFKIKLINIK